MALRKCCVGGCNSTNKTHRLTHIPKNDKLRDLWLSFLVPTNIQLSGLSKDQLVCKFVCQNHFDRHQFNSIGDRLRHGYPCLFSDKEILYGIPLSSSALDHLSDHTYSSEISSQDSIGITRMMVNEDLCDHSYCPEITPRDSMNVISAIVIEDVVMHVFPNPDKYPERFKTWISLVGRDLGKSDHEIFKKRRICDVHFSVDHRNRFKRLNNMAVPTLHLPKSSSTRQSGANIDTHTAVCPLSTEVLEPANQIAAVDKFCDDRTLSNKDKDALVSQLTFSWQMDDMVPVDIDEVVEDGDVVPIDEVGEGVLLHEKTPHPRGDNGSSAVLGLHKQLQCNICNGDIIGFRYACVQCADYDLCGACEARGKHAQHYVLRVPGPRPYAEVQAVLQRIRLELSVMATDSECPVEVKVKSELNDEAAGAECEGEKSEDPLHIDKVASPARSEHSDHVPAHSNLEDDMEGEVEYLEDLEDMEAVEVLEDMEDTNNHETEHFPRKHEVDSSNAHTVRKHQSFITSISKPYKQSIVQRSEVPDIAEVVTISSNKRRNITPTDIYDPACTSTFVKRREVLNTAETVVTLPHKRRRTDASKLSPRVTTLRVLKNGIKREITLHNIGSQLVQRSHPRVTESPVQLRIRNQRKNEVLGATSKKVQKPRYAYILRKS